MKSAANNKTATPLLGKIKLCSELGPFLSDNRIKLLDAIHQHGSLSAAARALPMSYKAAWDALDSMNNLANELLVIRTAGGLNGGCTQLTPYALRLISLYKALELEYQAAFENLKPAIANPSSSCTDNEIIHFRQLMRRMNFRSSARNQLMGTVNSITNDGVNSLVSINVSPQLNITAMISHEAVAELNLTVGSEVLALLKASQITVSLQPIITIDLTNQFTGKLTQICDGKAYSDLCIELADHKTLNAIVSNNTLDLSKLYNDMQLTVSFHASSIILCYYY